MEGNIQAYKKAFGTMDKVRQVIMLYETAIASLHQAKEHIAEKNIQECYNKTEKAYLIISGLRDCVNMEVGGDVAKTLVDWYSDTSLRIISINRTHDIALCDLCISNLREMKEAWVEVERLNKKESENDSENQEGSDQVSLSSSNSNKTEDSGGDYFVASVAAEKPKMAASGGGSGGSIYNQSLIQGLSLSI